MAAVRTRGLPFWALLVALVLAPVVGVLTLSSVLVGEGVERARGAARAADQIHAVSLLQAASVGLEQEIVPSMAQTALASPATVQALGLPHALTGVFREASTGELQARRNATSGALGTVQAQGATEDDRRVATEVAAQLTTLRAEVDRKALSQAEVAQVYDAFQGLVGRLSAAEARSADLTDDRGVSHATTVAVLDVQQIAALAQSASAQLAPYFAVLGQSADLPGVVGAYAAATSAYQQERALMARLLQPALQQAWNVVRADPPVLAADRDLSAGPAAGHPTEATLTTWVALIADNGGRDTAYAGLVATAVRAADAAVAGDRHDARGARDHTLVLAGVVIALTVLVGLLVGLSVTRALGGLARQARRLDDAALADAPVERVSGPREVRQVSSALTNALRSLHRVQQQARAVAAGDLSDASLEQPLPGALGEMVHTSAQRIVASLRERDEMQTALTYEANHDALTGLPNRGRARELVGRALVQDAAAGRRTGLLFVDLDGFKAINDTYGHACGDEVLRVVAGRLRAQVRTEHTVARLGGDEFVVLAGGLDGEDEHADGATLLALAERLIGAVRTPVHTGLAEHPLRLGASVGAAVAARESSLDALFAEADVATYEAKSHGRNRARLFDVRLRRELAERVQLEQALATALADDALSVAYQPVYGTDSGALHGFEALVRWTPPGGPPIGPDRFIPVAERSRLVCALDVWVLRAATRQAVVWRDLARATDPTAPGPTVAVNVSGRHLAEPGVVEDVREALAAAGLTPSSLTVEVTETVLVDNPLAAAHLTALRELGVRIALDDFGTGYTSVGQLAGLPVDVVKIDRSFVASQDPGRQALVALMVEVAHTLDLEVVAEGVEEPEQRERLRRIGCTYVQGYLLGRPAAAEVATELVRLTTADEIRL